MPFKCPKKWEIDQLLFHLNSFTNSLSTFLCASCQTTQEHCTERKTHNLWAAHWNKVYINLVVRYTLEYLPVQL